MTQDKRQSLKRTFFRADVFASSPPNDPQPGVWLGPASVPPSLSLGLPPPFALDSDFHHHSLQLARALAVSPDDHSILTPSTTMPGRHYSKFIPPSLAMSELVCQKLDNDATDMLIDKWLERPHRPDSYYDWFQRVRERKHLANTDGRRDQVLLWNKGVFVPENIFTRTVDTGRLIPLDRTWVTHVYHHRSMKRLTMMPVIFSMVSTYSLPAPEPLFLRALVPNSSPNSCFFAECMIAAVTISTSSLPTSNGRRWTRSRSTSSTCARTRPWATASPV